ncbi:MAG: hydrogenase 3 maturation endopeptidase HyCI [Candidatus Atribacteria bacterium]|jgi:hydrogenase 3 maturation protease|nr:MAG: hydrogenase 3 maturation endopeptidase HyCI [Candidatus Atribacteria bacterium]
MKRMLLGVGNRLSHDDGVGPFVAQSLADSDWIAMDCGTALENASGIVSREKPDLLIIVDAAVMGEEPGTTLRLPIQANDRMLASTHGLPLTFVMDRISASAVKMILIGIEPLDLTFGEGLSPVVEEAAHRLIGILQTRHLEAIPEHGISQ